MTHLIDEYESHAGSVHQAIAGLSRLQLLTHPVPGTWSIQQIVIHLVDCEQVFADRIKRVIAEENPVLQEFSENAWMETLAVNSRPAEESAQLLALTRRQIATILRELPPAAVQRTGLHTQRGQMTLEALVSLANTHLKHHLKFLHEKRRLVQSSPVGAHS